MKITAPDFSLASNHGRPLRIGFTFNVKRIGYREGDSDAEFDSPATISAISKAIEHFGHRVIRIEATPELPATLAKKKVDLVFNIAEGFRGRNRESHVPALCEMLGIEYTGSDACALSVSLDKPLFKKIISYDKIRTPGFFMMSSVRSEIPPGIRYPLIVKPSREGTSKGIDEKSVVETEEKLRRRAGLMIRKYKQPAIVEEFIEGREITVGLIGWPRPLVLPLCEVIFLKKMKRKVYSYDLKQEWEGILDYRIPAGVSDKQAKQCADVAIRTFDAIGCRDMARVDLILPAAGSPYVIEINPLPGLSPVFSDLSKIGEVAGMDHNGLIGSILQCGIARLTGAG